MLLTFVSPILYLILPWPVMESRNWNSNHLTLLSSGPKSPTATRMEKSSGPPRVCLTLFWIFAPGTRTMLKSRH
ncbi:hypothetical protein BC941DRAFT_414304 [Chlamydoabsidia padenii]|nr:hypothetical protein BC941DRAFT_414304 [Chlamydoabsidia padenii]